jgi:hypothetical protein
LTDLAPDATNSTSLVVGVDTATVGVKTGTATITLTSTGAGTSGLGDTPLVPQTVNVQAQVNNFAAADVVKLSGDGNFNMTAASEFTLDLGTIVTGQNPLVATLGIRNTAAAPADDLAGTFALAAPAFNLNGFSAFGPDAAGATHGGLAIELDDSAVGMFTGQITLQPRSTNPQPFSMDLTPITIRLTAEVQLAGDYNADGVVDASDFVMWRDSVGTQTTLAGDPTPGSVTQADYYVWRSNFRRTSGGMSAHLADAPAVPEPTTVLLLIMVGLAVSLTRFALQRLDSSRNYRFLTPLRFPTTAPSMRQIMSCGATAYVRTHFYRTMRSAVQSDLRIMISGEATLAGRRAAWVRT